MHGELKLLQYVSSRSRDVHDKIMSFCLLDQASRTEPQRFKCLLFWNCYYYCILFLNPSDSPVHLCSVLLHPRWMEDLSSCSPAESHCSGAAVGEVWRAPPESLFSSALSRKYITIEHTRSGQSHRLLLLPCRDARALPSFCPSVPLSLRVSLYGLESKHRHCPWPYIHSGHLLLYILLYLKPVLNMSSSFGTDRMERMFMYSI